MEFSEVINHLQEIAAEIESQHGGQIRLGVVGLDLRPALSGDPVPRVAKEKTTPSKRTPKRNALPKGAKPGAS